MKFNRNQNLKSEIFQFHSIVYICSRINKNISEGADKMFNCILCLKETTQEDTYEREGSTLLAELIAEHLPFVVSCKII